MDLLCGAIKLLLLMVLSAWSEGADPWAINSTCSEGSTDSGQECRGRDTPAKWVPWIAGGGALAHGSPGGCQFQLHCCEFPPA